MPKPEEMDDAAFTKAKNEKLAMCHDGIGVAEVKTGKYDDAIAELNQSVELSTTPDPVDFYLLGVANQQTSHFTDSIAAYTKCSTAGPLQAQCKSNLEDVKKKSQNSLEAPK
jgi:tetratricopeptide (TPR) repeat protein